MQRLSASGDECQTLVTAMRGRQVACDTRWQQTSRRPAIDNGGDDPRWTAAMTAGAGLPIDGRDERDGRRWMSGDWQALGMVCGMRRQVKAGD